MVALVGVSTPIFWSGLILILLFSVRLEWLPAGGTGGLSHLVLPAVSLGLYRPFLWLAAATAALAVAIRRRSREELPLIGALFTSGLLTTAQYLVLGVGADYRFVWWPVLAWQLCVILVAAKSAARRTRPGCRVSSCL